MIKQRTAKRNEVDLYLPHLKPKLAETVNSTRNSTELNTKNYKNLL